MSRTAVIPETITPAELAERLGWEHVVVSCCGWIHHVQIGPHAHARPDQTGAQFAARLVCRKCGKRPEEYRIERSPTHGHTLDLSNLLSYRSRRD